MAHLPQTQNQSSGIVNSSLPWPGQSVLNCISEIASAACLLRQNSRKDVPEPDLRVNSNQSQMNTSLQIHVRGIKSFVQDYAGMTAIVTRIKEVIENDDMLLEMKQ